MREGRPKTEAGRAEGGLAGLIWEVFELRWTKKSVVDNGVPARWPVHSDGGTYLT